MSAAATVLRVGCPMWAHPPWVGTYLSAANAGRELSEYARWCNAVEGNTTFYAEPAKTTIDRWAQLAPNDFRFAFKLPRTITHERRLHASDDLLASFLRRIDPLGERIGPMHVQLPPSLGPESLGVLSRFVAALPGSYAWTIELRHGAFFSDGAAHRAVDEVLAEHAVGRVVLDTRPLYATSPRTDASFDERRSKPKLPVVTNQMGPFPIVRVIGEDSQAGTLSGLRTWIPTIVDWLTEGREPYLFVHQPENLDSPLLARRIHAEIAAQVRSLAPLPEPIPVAPKTEVIGQDSLFD